MSAHMVSVACFGPVGSQPEAVGRFVPRGNRCHVGRSVPLNQHAMELSDDE